MNVWAGHVNVDEENQQQTYCAQAVQGGEVTLRPERGKPRLFHLRHSKPTLDWFRKGMQLDCCDCINNFVFRMHRIGYG